MAEPADDAMRRIETEPVRFNYLAAEFSYSVAELLPYDR